MKSQAPDKLAFDAARRDGVIALSSASKTYNYFTFTYLHIYMSVSPLLHNCYLSRVIFRRRFYIDWQYAQFNDWSLVFGLRCTH